MSLIDAAIDDAVVATRKLIERDGGPHRDARIAFLEARQRDEPPPETWAPNDMPWLGASVAIDSRLCMLAMSPIVVDVLALTEAIVQDVPGSIAILAPVSPNEPRVPFSREAWREVVHFALTHGLVGNWLLRGVNKDRGVIVTYDYRIVAACHRAKSANERYEDPHRVPWGRVNIPLPSRVIEEEGIFVLR